MSERTSMSHSRGPWTCGPDLEFVKDADGASVCWISGTNDHLEGNGALIIAAPDLLAACKAALPGLESAIAWAVGTSVEEQRENNPLIAQVRDAIAKAEGKS